MSSKNIYYVYAYLRKDGTPYYIGKGSGKRAWTKGKYEVSKPDDSRIILIEQNLTKTGSLAIERRLIRWYGRIDIGTGILRNQTDGGDGGTGNKRGSRLSEETKLKISIAHKGKSNGPMTAESKKKLSDSMKGKNLGKSLSNAHKIAIGNKLRGRKKEPLSEVTKEKLRKKNLGKVLGPMRQEHKDKISDALKGRKHSEEHIQKQRQKVKGRIPGEAERQNFLIALEAGKKTCIHCGINCTKGNYIRWHGEMCKYNI